jgi:hypothetical protein
MRSAVTVRPLRERPELCAFFAQQFEIEWPDLTPWATAGLSSTLRPGACGLTRSSSNVRRRLMTYRSVRRQWLIDGSEGHGVSIHLRPR